MVSITVSLEPELKKEISMFSWVNWSEVGREELLRQDEKIKLFEELEELTKDSKLTDKDCLRFAKLVKERFSKSQEQS